MRIRTHLYSIGLTIISVMFTGYSDEVSSLPIKSSPNNSAWEYSFFENKYEASTHWNTSGYRSISRINDSMLSIQDTLDESALNKITGESFQSFDSELPIIETANDTVNLVDSLFGVIGGWEEHASMSTKFQVIPNGADTIPITIDGNARIFYKVQSVISSEFTAIWEKDIGLIHLYENDMVTPKHGHRSQWKLSKINGSEYDYNRVINALEQEVSITDNTLQLSADPINVLVSDNILQIENIVNKNCTISLFTLNGRNIYQMELQNSNAVEVIQIPEHIKGMFILNISGGAQLQTKIIVD